MVGEGQVGLILEPNSSRAALMYQRLPEKVRGQIIWCQKVSEAINVLRSYKKQLSFVSLEHDIEQEQQHFGSETSGMEIVRFLEKENSFDYEHCLFVVHTWNEFAAQRMEERLKAKGLNCKLVPFGT